MACKVSREAASLRAMMYVPEDGFDEGEFDQNNVYTNRVGPKICSKALSMGIDSKTMKSRRSDSALMCCISTMSGPCLSESESDATTCGSTYSTRESSVEDAGANRKMTVSFGDAEELEEAKPNDVFVGVSSFRTDKNTMFRGRVNVLADSPSTRCIGMLETDDDGMRRDRALTDLSTPCMVDISGLAANYSTMHQARVHTRSMCEGMFHMTSARADEKALGSDYPQKVNSTLGSIWSVTMDSSRAQTEDYRIEAMVSSRKHRPCATSHYRSENEEGTKCTRTEFNSKLPHVTMPSIVSNMATPCVASTMYTPTRLQAQSSQIGDVPSCLADLQEEFQQLQEKRQELLEERQRLLAAPSECSGVPDWTIPAPWTPPGCWSHLTEAGRNHACTIECCQSPTTSHEKTTIIIQNLPSSFERDSVVDLLISQGFAKQFNFIYAPVKFATMTLMGYAFVNFVSSRSAEECRSKLDGFSDFGTECADVLSVVWSENDQGLKAIIDRHRNSPVMHSSIQDRFKPAIYKEGLQVKFPAPTKKIKPPRKTRLAPEDNESGATNNW